MCVTAALRRSDRASRDRRIVPSADRGRADPGFESAGQAGSTVHHWAVAPARAGHAESTHRAPTSRARSTGIRLASRGSITRAPRLGPGLSTVGRPASTAGGRRGTASCGPDSGSVRCRDVGVRAVGRRSRLGGSARPGRIAAFLHRAAGCVAGGGWVREGAGVRVIRSDLPDPAQVPTARAVPLLASPDLRIDRISLMRSGLRPLLRLDGSRRFVLVRAACACRPARRRFVRARATVSS